MLLPLKVTALDFECVTLNNKRRFDHRNSSTSFVNSSMPRVAGRYAVHTKQRRRRSSVILAAVLVMMALK